MKLLIKNGTVINPGDKKITKADVLVTDGVISKIAPELKDAADETYDAKGCYVMPGFIDLHVHLRDPGLEYKEDIQTGGAAALHGGFTTIVAMPNTKPVADKPDVINYVKNKAEAVTKVHVLQAGAVTKGQKGEELSDIRGMAAAGSPAISEDGKSVMNAQLYREGMKIAAEEGLAVLAHCEDINLVQGGVVNADEITKKQGLAGITNSVEDVIIARDIILAKETGARLHLCHCSTKDSVTMVKEAKADGLPVTAEVCPHHFTLSTEDMVPYDTNYKMNPPLRTKADVEALRQGLKEDIMDVIATDHAPHTQQDKNQSMQKAPFGIVGIETVAALTYSELVLKGYLTPMQMAEKMSYNPAKVIGSDRGSLEAGKDADIVIFNPKKTYQIDKNNFASKGRNTPFDGRTVTGEVEYTICGGKMIYEKEMTGEKA